jgi:hypothetical protein
MCLQLPALLTEHTTLQTTLAVSNVPGPMEPVMFNGNPIVHIYPAAAGQPSVSISMHYTSTSKPYAVDAILKMNTVTMPARTFVFSVALILICVPVAAVTINFLSEL